MRLVSVLSLDRFAELNSCAKESDVFQDEDISTEKNKKLMRRIVKKGTGFGSPNDGATVKGNALATSGELINSKTSSVTVCSQTLRFVSKCDLR